MQSHYKFSTINKTTSNAHGMTLVIVDGGKYKDMIAARMKRPNGNGSWMVYKGCDEEYAEQVTAEHKVREKNGKKAALVWKPKTTHADNHYLDAEVYAMAAADKLGVRTLHLDSVEEVEQEEVTEEQTPEENWIQQHESWIGD